MIIFPFYLGHFCRCPSCYSSFSLFPFIISFHLTPLYYICIQVDFCILFVKWMIVMGVLLSCLSE